MDSVQTPEPGEAARPSPPVRGAAFERSLAHFAAPIGRDILGRVEPFVEWQDERRSAGVWPYSRSLDSAPGPRSTMRTETGEVLEGLNFASQDYLGLSSHPAVADAAVQAIRSFGPHSAGSPALAGNTGLSLALERSLAEFLGYEQVLLYPTGWAAGFGVITGLVRAFDHVIIDVLAHSCLQVGAAAATRNIHRVGHLDIDAVRDCLKKIRARDTQGGILVVTEGLFSMDADTPDIRMLLRVSREYSALLMVDVAHDFGSIGPFGKGALAEQGVLGDVDLVMGAFSKTFASNGGFVATHSRAVRQYLKYYSSPCIFSNAISPVACAIISESLRIVASPEGDARRAQLLRAVGALRSGLESRGVRPMGRPSPIVPVPVGDEKVGRLSSLLLASKHSVFANFVEFPAVGVGQARYRFQVMASHSVEQADSAAGAVVDSMAEARGLIERGGTSD